MEKKTFAIDENGHIISEEETQDPQQPENAEDSSGTKTADKILNLGEEIRAYTRAVDDKNQLYGIKNYAKGNDGSKKGFPESLTSKP